MFGRLYVSAAAPVFLGWKEFPMFEGLARKQHLLSGKSFPHGFSNWRFPLLVDSYVILSLFFFLDGKKQNWFTIGEQTGGMF